MNFMSCTLLKLYSNLCIFKIWFTILRAPVFDSVKVFRVYRINIQNQPFKVVFFFQSIPSIFPVFSFFLRSSEIASISEISYCLIVQQFRLKLVVNISYSLDLKIDSFDSISEKKCFWIWYVFNNIKLISWTSRKPVATFSKCCKNKLD